MANKRTIGVAGVFDLTDFNAGLKAYLDGLSKANDSARATVAALAVTADSTRGAANQIRESVAVITEDFAELKRVGVDALSTITRGVDSLTEASASSKGLKTVTALTRELEKATKNLAKVREDTAKKIAKLEEDLGKAQKKAAEDAAKATKKLADEKDKSAKKAREDADKIAKAENKASEAKQVSEQKIAREKQKTVDAAKKSQIEIDRLRQKSDEAALTAAEKLRQEQQKTADAVRKATQDAASAQQKLDAAAATSAEKLRKEQEKTAEVKAKADERVAAIRARSDEKAADAAEKLRQQTERTQQLKAQGEQKVAAAQAKAAQAAEQAAERLRRETDKTNQARAEGAEKVRALEAKTAQIQQTAAEKVRLEAQKVTQARAEGAQKIRALQEKNAQAAQQAAEKLAQQVQKTEQAKAEGLKRVEALQAKADQAAAQAAERLAQQVQRTDQLKAEGAKKIEALEAKASQAAQQAAEKLRQQVDKTQQARAEGAQKIAALEQKAEQAAQQAAEKLAQQVQKTTQARAEGAQKLRELEQKADQAAQQAAEKLAQQVQKTQQAKAEGEQKIAGLIAIQQQRVLQQQEKLRQQIDKTILAREEGERKLAAAQERSAEKAAQAAERLRQEEQKTAQARAEGAEKVRALEQKTEQAAAQAAEKLAQQVQRTQQAKAEGEQKIAGLIAIQQQRVLQQQEKLRQQIDKTILAREEGERKLAAQEDRNREKALQAAERLRQSEERTQQIKNEGEQKYAQLVQKGADAQRLSAERLAQQVQKTQQAKAEGEQRIATLQQKANEQAEQAAEKLRQQVERTQQVRAEGAARVRAIEDKAAQAAEASAEKLRQQVEKTQQIRAEGEQRIAALTQKIQDQQLNAQEKLRQQVEKTQQIRIEGEQKLANLAEKGRAAQAVLEERLRTQVEKTNEARALGQQRLADLQRKSDDRALADAERLEGLKQKFREQAVQFELKLQGISEAYDRRQEAFEQQQSARRQAAVDRQLAAEQKLSDLRLLNAAKLEQAEQRIIYLQEQVASARQRRLAERQIFQEKIAQERIKTAQAVAKREAENNRVPVKIVPFGVELLIRQLKEAGVVGEQVGQQVSRALQGQFRSGGLDDAIKKFNDISATLQQVSDEYNDASQAIDKYGKNTEQARALNERLSQSLREAGQQYQTIASQITASAQATQKHASATGQDSAANNALVNSLNAAASKLNTLGTNLLAASNQSSALANNTKLGATSILRFANNLSKLATSSRSTGQSLTATQRAMQGLSQAIAARINLGFFTRLIQTSDAAGRQLIVLGRQMGILKGQTGQLNTAITAGFGAAIGTVAVNAMRNLGQSIRSAVNDVVNIIGEFERFTLTVNFFAANALRATDQSLSVADSLKATEEEARGVKEALREIAIFSPFTNTQVNQIFRTAIGIGLGYDQAKILIPQLIDLGAAAGLSAYRLDNLALAIAQVSTNGRLMGQEVRQLSESGIPIQDILVRNLGIAQEEFRELLEAGAFTADVVLPILTQELRKFEGAAKKASLETTSGLISSLTDLKEIATFEFFGTILERIRPQLREFVEFVTDPKFIQTLKVIAEIIGDRLAAAVESLRANIQTLVTAFQAIDPNTKRTIATFIAVAAALTLVIGVAGLLSVAIPALINPLTLTVAAVSGFSSAWINNFNDIRNNTFTVTRDIVTYFAQLALKVVGFGENISRSLAQGIGNAVASVVSALGLLGRAVTYLLKPGSPPRLLPDLDIWGKEAADVYLEAWTKADFDHLQKFGGVVSTILRNLAGAGDIGELDANRINQALNKPLAQAVAEIREFGQASNGTLTAIQNAAGPVAEELLGFVSRMTTLINATNAVAEAQARLNAITAKYKDQIDPISQRLQEIADVRTAQSEAKEIEKLQRIIASKAAPERRKKEAALRLEEILLEQQLRTLERQRDSETTTAEQALDNAELQQQTAQDALDAFQERLRLQAEQIELYKREQEILERIRKQQEQLAKEAEENALKPLQDQLRIFQLQQEELRDLIRLFELQRILQDENATAAEKTAAALEIQEIGISRQIRAIEAAKLGVTLSDLEKIKIVLADIEKAKKGDGAAPDAFKQIAEGVEQLDGLDVEGALADFDNALKEVRESVDAFKVSWREQIDAIDEGLPSFLKIKRAADGTIPAVKTLTRFFGILAGILAGKAILGTLRTVAVLIGALIGPLRYVSSLLFFLARTVIMPYVVPALAAVGGWLLQVGGAILAFLGGPLTLIIAAIAAFGVAYYTNFLGFRDFVDGVVESVAGFFRNRLRPAIDDISDRFRQFRDIMDRNFNGLGTAAQGWFQPLIDAYHATIDDLFNAEGPLDLATRIANFGSILTLNLLDAILPGDQSLEKLKEIGANLMEGIFAGVDAFIKGEMTDRLREAVDAIVQSFKDFFGISSPSKLMRDEIGEPAAQGLLGGLRDFIIANAADIVKTAIGALVTALKTYLGIQSPSTLMHGEIGEPSGQGLLHGFRDYIVNNAGEIVRTAIGALVAALKTFLGIQSPSTYMAAEIGTPSGQGIIDGIRSAIGNGYEIVRLALTGLADFLFSAETLSAFVTKATGLGSAMMAGITQGLTDAYGGAKDALGGFLNGLLGYGEDEMEIRSPSRVFARRIGQPIGEGVNEGIGQATNDRLVEAISKVIIGVFTNMRDDSVKQVADLRDESIALFGKLRGEASDLVTKWRTEHAAVILLMRTGTISEVSLMRLDVVTHIRGMGSESTSAVISMRQSVETEAEEMRRVFVEKVGLLREQVGAEFTGLEQDIITSMSNMTAALTEALTGAGGMSEILGETFKSEGQVLGEAFGDAIGAGITSRVEDITTAAVSAVATAAAAARAAIEATLTTTDRRAPLNRTTDRALNDLGRVVNSAAQPVTNRFAPADSNVYPGSVTNNRTNVYNLNVESAAPSQGVINDFDTMRVFSL